MPKIIIASATTFLKKSAIGSADLPDSEKVTAKQGDTFSVTEYSPAANQHAFLKLESPVTALDGKTSLQEIYVYEPHVQVEGNEANTVIRLDVPYRSQLDNDPSIFGAGNRQCNLTSNTMMADFLLKGELTAKAAADGCDPNEPETAYGQILSKFGDTTDHDAQTAALKEIGIESYFTQSLSAADLLASLKVGIPIVIGVSYKGSGHMILVVGHDPVQKAWLVHDPYGTRHGDADSYDVGVGGNYDVYSYDVMQRIYFDMGNEAGWGRIVTSIKGKPTGLPEGL